MTDVQYTKALYSVSSRLRMACKIREQTYLAASNVAVFSSFLFADFILHKGNNEYFNQHCIFCRPSDFTVSEAARIVKTEKH